MDPDDRLPMMRSIILLAALLCSAALTPAQQIIGWQRFYNYIGNEIDPGDGETANCTFKWRVEAGGTTPGCDECQCPYVQVDVYWYPSTGVPATQVTLVPDAHGYYEVPSDDGGMVLTTVLVRCSCEPLPNSEEPPHGVWVINTTWTITCLFAVEPYL